MARTKPKPTHPVEIHFDTLSRYHYYIFAFLFISKIPVFWHMISMIFLSPRMSYTCPENSGKDGPNSCPCNKPKWDTSIFTLTMQMKFNLICDRKVLIQTAHSLLYAGTLVGAFMFGFLADRYGRLSMFCVSVLVMAIFGCLVSFMPNIVLFIIMRFFEGISVGGAIVTGYVLCVEYCGIRQRELVTALYHVPLNIGHMCLSGVSYLLRNMDHYQLAISIPVAVFASMYCLCYESPKWLMDSNQIDKAAATMEKIAKFNNTSYGDIKAEMVAYKATHMTSQQKESFKDLFKYRRLVINFFCMGFIYFVCGMGYYGVSQYIGQMSGDIHKNVALSGVMLIPATLSCIALLHLLSRRTFLILTNVCSGILMLVVVLLIPPNMTLAKVITACLGNCFFFMSFIIVFLYGVELFPTSVRNSVLGVLSVMSRAGQIIAPFVNVMSPKIAGCIFGILAITGGVLCIPLPETKNKELPSTMAAYGAPASPSTSSTPANEPPKT